MYIGYEIVFLCSYNTWLRIFNVIYLQFLFGYGFFKIDAHLFLICEQNCVLELCSPFYWSSIFPIFIFLYFRGFIMMFLMGVGDIAIYCTNVAFLLLGMLICEFVSWILLYLLPCIEFFYMPIWVVKLPDP